MQDTIREHINEWNNLKNEEFRNFELLGRQRVNAPRPSLTMLNFHAKSPTINYDDHAEPDQE